MRLRFRFRTVPFLATLILVLLGIALGNWQTRRAFDKTLLQARLEQGMAAPPLTLDGGAVDPARLEYRRVRVTGEFVDWPIYLDNRPQNGRTGFIVLMPFKIAGSPRHVLVARGWLPRNSARYGLVPPYATPAGQVTLEGRAVLHMPRVMELGASSALAPKAIVQNAGPDEVARASGLDLLPFIVEQTGASVPADGMTRDWPAPSLDIDRHKGYAVQWYALALMAFLFFVITGFRSGRS